MRGRVQGVLDRPPKGGPAPTCHSAPEPGVRKNDEVARPIRQVLTSRDSMPPTPWWLLLVIAVGIVAWLFLGWWALLILAVAALAVRGYALLRRPASSGAKERT